MRMRKHAHALAVASCLALLGVPGAGHATTQIAECHGAGILAQPATVLFGGCSTSFTQQQAPMGTHITIHVFGQFQDTTAFTGRINVTLAPQACPNGTRLDYCQNSYVYVDGVRISGGPDRDVYLPTNSFWSVYLDAALPTGAGAGSFQLTVTK